MGRSKVVMSSLLTAVAVVAALVTTPVSAKPLSDAQCVSYGRVAAAPKGKIPRDDLQSVRVDPLARWAAQHPAQASAATNDGEVATIPVVFHILRKKT